MAQFLRQIAVEFGQEGQQGTRVEGLRVDFRVEMSLTGTPNRARIVIHNLARSASEQLSAGARPRVRLLAGYDGQERLVFQGAPLRNGVRRQRQGTSYLTVIEAQDGRRGLAQGWVSRSWAAGTSYAAVLDEAIDQTGLGRGRVVPPSGQYPEGLVLDAPARDVLEQLAAASGSDWFVRDGAVYFQPEGEATGETAIRYSAEGRNLLGTPETTEQGHVRFTGLLDPTLRPGMLVQLDPSEGPSGTFVVRDLVFTGSQWDSAFTVEVTAVPRR